MKHRYECTVVLIHRSLLLQMKYYIRESTAVELFGALFTETWRLEGEELIDLVN